MEVSTQPTGMQQILLLFCSAVATGLARVGSGGGGEGGAQERMAAVGIFSVEQQLIKGMKHHGMYRHGVSASHNLQHASLPLTYTGGGLTRAYADGSGGGGAPARLEAGRRLVRHRLAMGPGDRHQVPRDELFRTSKRCPLAGRPHQGMPRRRRGRPRAGARGSPRPPPGRPQSPASGSPGAPPLRAAARAARASRPPWCPGK